MNKHLNVVIGFHSHEPSWEVEQSFLHTLGRKTGQEYFPITNYFVQNFPEEKPLHDYLLEMTSELNIPVWLDGSNEIYDQVYRYRPEGFERLQNGFRQGYIHRVLTHAHHVHTSLATPTEHIQEIRLNQQYLDTKLQTPTPTHEGLFSPEASYRPDLIETYTRLGLEYLIFPNLQSRKTPFQVKSHTSDLTYEPYWVESSNGDRILALPINTNISERVWLALEAGGFDVVHTQAEKSYEARKAIEFYKEIIYQECENAPNNGLLLYASDFEFMGLAPPALSLIKETWKEILEEGKYDFTFHSPDSYVDTLDTQRLSVITCNDVSWAPAHTHVFRFDGCYPAIDSSDADLYSEFPFIFWQTGRIFSNVVNYLYELYLPSQTSLELPLTASALDVSDISTLSSQEQVSLHNLLLKRACNWGWMVTEDRARWSFVHLGEIASLLTHLSLHPNEPLSSRGQTLMWTWRELLRFDLTRRIEHTAHAIEQTYLDADSSMSTEDYTTLTNYIHEARSTLHTLLSKLNTLFTDTHTHTPLQAVQGISEYGTYILDCLTRVYNPDYAYLERLIGHKNGHIYYQTPQLPDFLRRMQSKDL